MRALILVRLSRLTDASTSPERQRQDCEAYCLARGWSVAGVAEDLDVSGQVDPLQRSGSGPWLRDRLAEFDVVVAAKLDRVGRTTAGVHGLFQYLREHGKVLVTADGAISTEGPAGELILFVLAWAAAMEWQAISDRNKAAATYNIAEGKYRGGVVPVGYIPEKRTKGYVLVPDEDGLAPVIRKVVRRVLDGDRITTIVSDLNDRGVPTQKDRQDVLNGRQPSGRRWSVSNMRRTLASRSLIGEVDGSPVRHEGLISNEDYGKVQRILADRVLPQQRRSTETTLLLHVIHCGLCERPMYKLTGGKGRQPRYRCSSAQHPPPCGNRSAVITEMDGFVEGVLLAVLGRLPRVEKRSNPGASNAREMAEIEAELDTLAVSVPKFPAGSSGLKRLLDRVDVLSARLAELKAMPAQDPGFEYVLTGDTFGEHYQSLTVPRRNDFLREHGVRVTFTHHVPPQDRKTPPTIELVLGEFVEMVRYVDPSRELDWEEFAKQANALFGGAAVPSVGDSVRSVPLGGPHIPDDGG